MGWHDFFTNLLFWVLVIGAKFAFDWFAVMKTLEAPVLGLWNRGWLTTGTGNIYINGWVEAVWARGGCRWQQQHQQHCWVLGGVRSRVSNTGRLGCLLGQTWLKRRGEAASAGNAR